MSDRIHMWRPEAGYNFINGDYKYTVIYEKTKDLTIVSGKTYYIYNSSTEKYEVVISPAQEDIQNYYEDFNHLHAEVVDKIKTSYAQIENSFSFNGQVYTVVSLEGCFQNCNNLITAPIISSDIINLNSCFEGCTNLQDTITIYNWPQGGISHTNIFLGTQKDIYVIRDINASLDADNIRSLTENYPNVYFEAESNPAPSIVFNYERGNYSSGTWTVDDSGDDIRLQGQVLILTNKLPANWTNNLLPQDLQTPANSGIRVFWGTLEEEITTNATTHIVINNNEITIYVENQENAGTIKVTATDKYNHSSSDSEYVTQSFVLLDFIPGGLGMAIGKAGNRNGLDISLPTTIGKGLIPPDHYVETTDTVVQANKTYYIRSGVSEPYTYTEVIDPTGNPLSQGWYEYEEVALDNPQLVVGKYNEKNNNAIFIVGNGINNQIDPIVRSNLMEIGNNEIRLGSDKSNKIRTIIDDNGMRILRKESNNTDTLIANLGYGQGYDSQGQLINAPFYTFGTRHSTGTIGNYSIAEGIDIIASGYASHAEGINTTAMGSYSHAEGYYTKAAGRYSHAEGYQCMAGISLNDSEGRYTHAQNQGTIAAANAQTTLGTFNITDTIGLTTTHPSGSVMYGQYALIIGNGTADNARSNALTVDWEGRVVGKYLALDSKIIDLSKTDNDITTSAYLGTVSAHDKSNRLLSCHESAADTNGNVRSYWILRNYDTSGTQVASKGITMTMNKSGTLTYSISDAANFRSALGLAAVAASGSYADLSNKPTIATITNSVIKKVTRISVAESTSSTYTTSDGEKTIIFAIGAGQFYLFLGNTTSAGTCTSYKIGGNDTDVTITSGTNKFTLKNNSSAQVVFLIFAT